MSRHIPLVALITLLVNIQCSQANKTFYPSYNLTASCDGRYNLTNSTGSCSMNATVSVKSTDSLSQLPFETPFVTSTAIDTEATANTVTSTYLHEEGTTSLKIGPLPNETYVFFTNKTSNALLEPTVIRPSIGTILPTGRGSVINGSLKTPPGQVNKIENYKWINNTVSLNVSKSEMRVAAAAAATPKYVFAHYMVSRK